MRFTLIQRIGDALIEVVDIVAQWDAINDSEENREFWHF
jgi:hypothetical protein